MPDFKGAKYRDTQFLDVTEVAKLMRTDLRNAQIEGRIPSGMTYRVTVQRYGGGQRIDIHLSGMPDTWTYDMSRRYSSAAKDILSLADTIHSAYNYDRSDIMSDHYDTKFYGTVELLDERDQVFEAREKFVRAARKRAAAQRKAAGLSNRGFEAQLTADQVERQARAEFAAQHSVEKV